MSLEELRKQAQQYPSQYCGGQAGSGAVNGPAVEAENITQRLLQTHHCINQIEGIVEGIIERVCGAMVNPGSGAEKRPEPRSVRELTNENLDRLAHILQRLSALVVDIGEV